MPRLARTPHKHFGRHPVTCIISMFERGRGSHNLTPREPMEIKIEKTPLDDVLIVVNERFEDRRRNTQYL